jgi:cell division GTPase FtsZ
MKLGFVGIGQGGSNIAAAFSDKFPVVCINTAKQDLENLPIPPDFKIFAKISEGGAGKDVRLGERAIEENREVIAQKIDLAMRDRDLVFVAAGLGGGTGSLGLLQILEILGEKGLNHSVIATFPMSSEGTNEKLNAVLAARQLHKALKESPSFRSIIFIDIPVKIQSDGTRKIHL